MPLLTVRDITHAFGGPPVLDGAKLQVEKGDRVCLFGRNGEGKSTLLRIIEGRYKPDAGAIDVQRGAVVGALAQEVPEAQDGSVFDAVIGGLGEAQARLTAYHDAVAKVATDPSDKHLDALARAQSALEASDGWDLQYRVEMVLSKLSLDGDVAFASLSGGWRRRVFLARALVAQPDVLLLDEPTNHLDIEAIEWLEGVLNRYEGALIFVTHDRTFLRRVATRIVDLDRGQLTEYPSDFDAYLEAKAHALDVEAEQAAQFDKKLAEEEAWIRTGIKARRTRNEGRVRALQRLRAERKRRRTRKGTASLKVQTAEKSGEIVLVAKQLGFAYGDNTIVRDLSLTVKRGDRVGLIGPNGVGKTTLLRILLGELEAQSGQLRLGTRLQVRYYDQLRDALKPDQTVVQTIVDKGDTVEIGGKRKHVIGYLRDFLFDDDQAHVPVSVLSGGERNRLLLAKLFAEPANVLVLDEPTNDLDMETLEVLEAQLLAFPGTVLLVSHDREFMDNVVTESLVFQGEGAIERFVGGYNVWEAVRDERARAVDEARRAEAQAAREAERAKAQAEAPKRLTYKEREELDALPAQIEAMDEELETIHAALGDPAVARDPARLKATTQRLEALETELAAAYERWEALEARE